MQIKVYTIDVKLPRWLKRGALFVAIPLFVLGIAAGVRAAGGFPLPPFASYQKSEMLTADGLNTRFNTLREASNNLATAIDSLQTGLSTAQGQIGTINTKLDKASVALALGVGLPKTAKYLGPGVSSGEYPSSDCQPGEAPISGACTASGTNGSMAVKVSITASYPSGLHWNCIFQNNEPGDVVIESRVICAKATLGYTH